MSFITDQHHQEHRAVTRRFLNAYNWKFGPQPEFQSERLDRGNFAPAWRYKCFTDNLAMWPVAPDVFKAVLRLIDQRLAAASGRGHRGMMAFVIERKPSPFHEAQALHTVITAGFSHIDRHSIAALLRTYGNQVRLIFDAEHPDVDRYVGNSFLVPSYMPAACQPCEAEIAACRPYVRQLLEAQNV